MPPATSGPGDGRYPEDRPSLSPGCTYPGSAARYPHTDGAFSRYATLPARMLHPLPAGLALRTAALVEPASVAWHAVARAGDVAGKTALVIGCGPIGALAVAVLKRAGARRIVAVDMHDRPLEIARAVGADEVLKCDGAAAIAAMADGTLFADPVVTHTFTLDDGLVAFEAARNSAVSGKVLLDCRPAAVE